MNGFPKEGAPKIGPDRAASSFVPERDLVLLLTATIRPNPAFQNAGTGDAEERTAQYEEALAHSLHHCPEIRSIVLVENSGADLGTLRTVAKDNPLDKVVEFVSFTENEFPPGFKKGYAESVLIDRALNLSRELASHSHFAKLTGRLWIRNLSRLLRRAPENLLLYADVRDHHIYQRLGLKSTANFLDTRFFVVDREFYDDHFRRLYLKQDSGEFFYLEDDFLHVASSLEGLPGVLLRFPIEPAFRGKAGHWRKSYSGPKERLKRAIRAGLRRTVPRLKI